MSDLDALTSPSYSPFLELAGAEMRKPPAGYGEGENPWLVGAGAALRTMPPTSWGIQAVQGGTEALEKLGRAASGEYGVGRGLADKAVGPAWELATMAAGGASGFAEKGAAGVFGGRLAKTAQPGFLSAAELLAEKGVPREKIWESTGWFQGRDGKWRHEIRDTGMKVEQGRIKHPELEKAYPGISKIPIIADEDMALGNAAYYPPHGGQPEHIKIGGAYSSKGELSPPQLEAVVHEFQHAVQRREGFHPGDNPAASIQRIEDELFKVLNSSPPGSAKWNAASKAINDVRNADPFALSYQIYRRGQGEVEARNAADRYKMDVMDQALGAPEGSRTYNTPPWWSEDVPADKQLTYRGAGP